MASYDLGGTTLSVTERGRGPAVVFLHGFPLDARMWDAQVAALSEDFRIIVPDLRGFGRSTSPHPFTIESLADDVHTLLGRMDARRCVLAGLSMGGYVALAYAEKFPADLRGLLLIDTKAEADSADAKAGRQTMIDLVHQSGAAAVADGMVPKMLAKEAASHRSQQAAVVRQMMEACPPATIENALSAMRDRPDRTAELSSIKVPTLILVGDGDVITPPSVAVAMQEKMPNAELRVIQGAGHLSPMEQPEQVNRAIAAFLKRI